MKRRNRRLVAVVCFMVGTVVAGGGPTRAQSVAVPSPWLAQDIGAPAIAGSSSFDQTNEDLFDDRGRRRHLGHSRINFVSSISRSRATW